MKHVHEIRRSHVAPHLNHMTMLTLLWATAHAHWLRCAWSVFRFVCLL